MAFDPAWQYRLKITSQASQISAAYPYCLLYDCGANLAGVTDFWDNIKSDGSDIRVTLADGETEVARAARGFDVGSQTGRIYLKHPDISTSSNVDLWIYFGNAAASDYANDNALGYQGVWSGEAIRIHYPCDVEDISGTSLLDRSGNGLNGTLVNQASAGTGQVGGGIQFDGSGDIITRANSGNVVIPASNAAWTLQVWLNCTSIAGATTTRSLLANEVFGTSGVRVGIDGGSWNVPGGFRFDTQETGGSISCTGPAITMAAWHFATCSYTGSAAAVHMDGTTNYATDASGTIISNTTTLEFGGGQGGHRQWLGFLDEIRIFSRALTATEHATIYNNHVANTSFWATGEVEPTAPDLTQAAYRFFNDDGNGLAEAA